MAAAATHEQRIAQVCGRLALTTTVLLMHSGLSTAVTRVTMATPDAYEVSPALRVAFAINMVVPFALAALCLVFFLNVERSSSNSAYVGPFGPSTNRHGTAFSLLAYVYLIACFISSIVSITAPGTHQQVSYILFVASAASGSVMLRAARRMTTKQHASDVGKHGA